MVGREQMRVLSGWKVWKGMGDLSNPGQGMLGAENRKEQLLIPIKESVFLQGRDRQRGG